MAFLNEDNGVWTSARADTDNKPITDVSLKGSSKLKVGRASVATAGTRVQLPNIPCKEVTITGLKANKGTIFAGDETVSSQTGIELDAKDSFTFVVSNVNLVYIDAAVSGEGVTYVAI
ncbi:hypothetical protein [Bacillus sp. JJ722]|uniref:hypothetical protein n=1 Tax=Bacillus sp. JJ722 TaxID=3122973 RepID=UPI002FFE6862